jgi:hypothetical protein
LVTKTKRQRRGDAAFLLLRKSDAAGLLAEGVSDRPAHAKHVVRAETLIVVDVIVVPLGTHEDVGQAVPKIIAKAAADILHEVIAGGVVNASGAAAGAKEVEAVAGNADTGKKVEAKFLSQLGLEERVDISKDRAIIGVTVVASLVIPPGGFYVEAEPMPEGDNVTPEAGVDPTFFDQWLEAYDVTGFGRRQEDAGADQDVSLLGRGEVGEQVREHKNGTRGKEQREFSQYKSLVSWFGLLEFTHQTGATRRSSREWPRPGNAWAAGIGCPSIPKPAILRGVRGLVWAAADGVAD